MIDEKELTEWLLSQKYVGVNECDMFMSEEFEKAHQWELSRNTFINKIIMQIGKMMMPTHPMRAKMTLLKLPETEVNYEDKI